MSTNFDYLLEKKEYVDFANQAVEAEKSISISPAKAVFLGFSVVLCLWSFSCESEGLGGMQPLHLD